MKLSLAGSGKPGSSTGLSLANNKGKQPAARPGGGGGSGGLSAFGSSSKAGSTSVSSSKAAGTGKAKKNAFGDEDDDDDGEDEEAITSLASTSKAGSRVGGRGTSTSTSTSTSAGPKKIKGADPTRPGLNTASNPSRTLKKLHEEAAAIDPNIFSYDEVYDSMKAGAAALAEQRKREKEQEGDKPKYVSGLLKAAEQRRKDRIRAEDKLIELERAKEGDEFADKESFVTSAYKEQQAELRKAEEEEKKRESGWGTARLRKRCRSGHTKARTSILVELLRGCPLLR